MYNKLTVIITLSCLPFLLTLNGDFVFDDSEAIVKNKDVSSEPWTNAFYNDFWGTDMRSNLSHKSYRPLTILSFRLNYILNDSNWSALHFKITNLICHVICCILLWKVFEYIIHDNKKSNQSSHKPKQKYNFLKGLTEQWLTDIPYLSTLLFAVHPIHVEAICGIVGRADLLASMTFFLAFLSYNKAITSQCWGHIYLMCTVILSAISMLCKENGITVLGFCIVYEIVVKIRHKRSNSTKPKLFNRVRIDIHSMWRIIVLALAAAGLLYGRWIVMGRTKPEFKPSDNPTLFSGSIFTKVTTYNYIYFLNILLLIWPKWLCYDWSMGCIQLIKNVSDNRLVFVCLMYLYGILLLRAIYIEKSRKLKRVILLAVSLGVIPFLPATNILYPVGFVIAERILYLSSAGYCLLIVIGFSKLLERRSLLTCKIAVFLFILLLLVFAARSWQRSKAWHNEYNLFMSALAVCPLNAKVHYNVAKAADANHETSLAMTEYKEAIRLFPEYYQAMNNLANLLKNQKQYIEAEFFLRSAVRHKRDFPAAWMNLGIVLARIGKYDESESAYRTAINYRKKYPDCYYNLGNLYLELNNTEEAINAWLQAIDLNPKHVLAWTNLMALMDNTGQIERALKIIPKVLTELPEAPSIHFAIANMYGKLNRYSEAETHFLQTIKILDDKSQAIHYCNLGILYHRWKKYSLAKEMYTNALKIDPNFLTARKHLESLERINK